jgi:hypothetical protein
MTKAKREPEQILTNFLKNNLTDVNTSRSGQWVFPDFPLFENLGNDNFPRVGITKISEGADHLGMFDNDQWYTVNLQIDIVTKKDQGFTITVTDEALGTMSSTVNADRFTYDFVPNSVTNVKHAGTAYGTVTSIAVNSLFTSPGSLSAGTVEYSRSTGDLNFSSADVSSHDAEAITSTYTVFLSNRKLAQWVGREVINKVRTLWRTDATMNGLEYPVLVANSTIPIDEVHGVFRQTIEYRFNAFNLREGE